MWEHYQDRVRLCLNHAGITDQGIPYFTLHQWDFGFSPNFSRHKTALLLMLPSFPSFQFIDSLALAS